eukprot:CAMPEP_0194320354 /NCGR_PEP_ID=MMETSP0171-20130528/16701_1 /TAXON_ID=218684 /ORGANISM="Corethron pennatum, Strain L29A3" /LENGTH=317 /DNA_ID=CAMNT_0039077869 /DNA_START=1 /DNA_END=951 /DNA_ORIENTATION=+
MQGTSMSCCGDEDGNQHDDRNFRSRSIADTGDDEDRVFASDREDGRFLRRPRREATFLLEADHDSDSGGGSYPTDAPLSEPESKDDGATEGYGHPTCTIDDILRFREDDAWGSETAHGPDCREYEALLADVVRAHPPPPPSPRLARKVTRRTALNEHAHARAGRVAPRLEEMEGGRAGRPADDGGTSRTGTPHRRDVRGAAATTANGRCTETEGDVYHGSRADGRIHAVEPATDVELRELAENFRRMLPPPATEGSAAAGAGKADGILDSLRMDLKIGDWMRDIASKHGGGGPCRVPDGGAVAAGLEERQHEIFLRG